MASIPPVCASLNATCATFGYPTPEEPVLLTALGGRSFAADWLPPGFGRGDRARIVLHDRGGQMGLAQPAFGVHFCDLEADSQPAHVLFDGDDPDTLHSVWEGGISMVGNESEPLSAYKWAGLQHGFVQSTGADVYPNGAGPGLLGLPAGESRRLNSLTFVSNLQILQPSNGAPIATLQINHQISRDGLTIMPVLSFTDPDARCQTVYAGCFPSSASHVIVNGTSIAMPVPGETPNLGPVSALDFRWASRPGLAMRVRLPSGGSGPLGWAEAETHQVIIRGRKLYLLRFAKDVPGIPAPGVTQVRYQAERV